MPETLNPIVTAAGFAAHTGLTGYTAHSALVDSRLVSLQREAEAIMKRPCSVVVTNETVTDLLQGGTCLVTRRRPVLSVQSFTPTTTYTIARGLIVLDYQFRLYTGSPLVVSYTAGVEDPGSVASVIYARLERDLVRAIDKTQGATTVGEEGYSVNLVAPGWTPDEKEFLVSKKKRASA